MTLTRSFPTEHGSGLPIADTRLILAGLIARTTAGAPRLGVIPAHYNALVTGTAGMSYSIAPFVAATSRSGSLHVELVANDAATAQATTAAPVANSRIDVIWVRSLFPLYGDAGVFSPEFGVTSGTASATPTKPSIPAGAFELATAEILSTTTGTNTAFITQTFPYTSTAGGVVAVRNTTERGAWAPANGAVTFQIDTGMRYLRSGGAWVSDSRGLVLLSDQTVSAVTVVNAQSVFSSLYDEYIVSLIIRSTSGGGAPLAMQLLSGATPASGGTDYYTVSRSNSNTTITGLGSGAPSAPLTKAAAIAGGAVEITLYDPAFAGRTWGLIDSHGYGGTAAAENSDLSFHHNPATVYDGIRILTGTAATLTGKLKVYGRG